MRIDIVTAAPTFAEAGVQIARYMLTIGVDDYVPVVFALAGMGEVLAHLGGEPVAVSGTVTFGSIHATWGTDPTAGRVTLHVRADQGRAD